MKNKKKVKELIENKRIVEGFLANGNYVFADFDESEQKFFFKIVDEKKGTEEAFVDEDFLFGFLDDNDFEVFLING